MIGLMVMNGGKNLNKRRSLMLSFLVGFLITCIALLMISFGYRAPGMTHPGTSDSITHGAGK